MGKRTIFKNHSAENGISKRPVLSGKVRATPGLFWWPCFAYGHLGVGRVVYEVPLVYARGTAEQLQSGLDACWRIWRKSVTITKTPGNRVGSSGPQGATLADLLGEEYSTSPVGIVNLVLNAPGRDFTVACGHPAAFFRA